MKFKNIKSKKNLTKIFILGILFSIISIFFWYLDGIRLNNELDHINQVVELRESKSNEDNLLVNPPSEDDDLYWKYIKNSLLDVEFSELKNINPETVGWIQVLGTNINYPFVQHKDNYYYLDHSFMMKKNNAGWVFLDSRNDIKNFDNNTIIYAHGRIDSIMFGTLRNILISCWLSITNYHVIRLSKEYQNTLW